MIDIDEIAVQLYEIARKQEEEHPALSSLTGIELLKSLAGKVTTAAMSYNFRESYRKELEDIIHIVLLLAHKEDFDIEDMLRDVLARNVKND